MLGFAAGAPPARADGVRDAQAWVFDDLHTAQAWATTQGRGVTVAVLDSGVDPSVSDLVGSVTSGPDFTHAGTPPSDPGWGVHGTWMASLIAGHGHDGGGSGVLGIAPKAQILSIRVITDRGDPGYHRYQQESPNEIQQSLGDAIRYAVDHGAAVISMSIGYSAPSTTVRAALQYAADHGTVVAASSGNSGDSSFTRTHRYAPYSFPADYPGVVAVAAANQDGSPARFSSGNLSVQVTAPGVDVPAQGRDGQYWEVSGTSPACALVAGAVALIKARYPRLTPALVARAIVATTTGRPPRGYDEQVGFGMVDVAAALAEAKTLSRDVPDAGLSAAAFAGASGVAAPGQHFGGGPSQAAAPPVRPRGPWPLAGFGLLAVISLAVVVAAAARIAQVRRARLQYPDPPPGQLPGGLLVPPGPYPAGHPPRPDSAPPSVKELG